MAGIFDYQNGELALRVNGEEQTRTDSFQTAGATSDTDSLNIRIGADAVLGNPRGFFNGQIAELIVYDRALTDTELADVESYIVDKWLTFSVPEPSSATLVLTLALMLPARSRFRRCLGNCVLVQRSLRGGCVG